MQPELCFDLLQGSCPPPPFFFFYFIVVCGFVNNLHPSGRILLLSHLTDTHLRDFVVFVVSSVTYIRQGGILLITHLRGFVMSVALSVTYIC